MRTVVLGAALFLALLPLYSAKASGASLFLTPDSGVWQIGTSLTVLVRADTAGDTVGPIEGELAYDPKSVAVESLSVEGSILGTWSTAPSYDGATGVIRFSGWTREPYQGSDGVLLAIVLRPLKAGTTKLDITSGAMLAQGGSNNLITALKSGAYTIAPEQVTATPVPAPQETPAAPPQPPSLGTIPSTLAEGQPLVLKGMANPNATIAIWMSRNDEIPHMETVLSTIDGSFTYASNPLSPGRYHVWAQTTDAAGQHSNESDHETVVVEQNQMAAALLAGGDYLSFFWPLIAALVLIGLGLAYAAHRKNTAAQR